MILGYALTRCLTCGHVLFLDHGRLGCTRACANAGGAETS
jgi:hypothetical protein